ncbi:HypC/HybG/HupF family hydrogenase formation chaperone [bacterium]|nr:HypC/HybG/HupF family hydrogenase formation chaperone [bacterium]
MCLGIPAKVSKINGLIARVQVGGAEVAASIYLVPGVRAGDYVLLHAGFAIEIIDEQAAEETLDLLRKMVEEQES